MTDFWRSAGGMYRVEVTSASLEACFNRMNMAQIQAFCVCRDSELSARFLIMRKDLEKLKVICEKQGGRLEVCVRLGLYWKIRKAVNRPVLIIGFLALTLLSLILPRYILFVQVEGNVRVPERVILEAAEQCGISFGTSRKDIRSEQVKNGMLSLIPELKWAGVNTKGCVAVISVREDAAHMEETPVSVASVVAGRDGVIVGCTATKGNLLVKEGQVVKRGQILISAYTDCGLSIQATRAEGEIYAQTIHGVRAVKPLECAVRAGKEEIIHRYGFVIGKKRIKLWKDSGIWDATCGRMYQEYYLILPGGFQLPIAVWVETVTPYSVSDFEMACEEAEPLLADAAKTHLLENMVAGTVQKSDTRTFQENGLAVMEGTFLCTEMIGRIQTEQIGETHGKTD